MRERSEQILKFVCLALGLLLAFQLVKAVMRANPLAGVAVPDLPSLPAETNVDAKVVSKKPMKTNSDATASATTSKTNTPTTAAATNNLLTNTPTIASTDTNAASPPNTAVTTNSFLASAHTNDAPHTTPTNTVVRASNNINVPTPKLETGTNALTSQSADANTTNTASLKTPSRKGRTMAGLPGVKGDSLPPEIQARVNRVTDSEILGPVMHPMPMALLGIAGNVAFLRSPSGQTGLIKEGEDLGEIKLLRIGTNRVLVEENGEKKELMIFAGLGGESLLPKTESLNETTNRN